MRHGMFTIFAGKLIRFLRGPVMKFISRKVPLHKPTKNLTENLVYIVHYMCHVVKSYLLHLYLCRDPDCLISFAGITVLVKLNTRVTNHGVRLSTKMFIVLSE